MISNNFDHVGKTLGPEVSRQVPPVANALDRLEKDLHFLREGVSQLNQRLGVVMRPTPVNDKAEKQMTAGGSQLVNQIDSLSQLTRYISADVSAMLDCIEL
jgi:hypothetical protein